MTGMDMPGNWYGAEMATLGDRIAGAREAQGLSQRQLASRLGIAQKTLANWENDTAEPRANKMQMLAGLLGVSLMWLLNGEGDGIAAPDQPRPDAEATAVLAEVRQIRGQIDSLSHRLGPLEQRLRQILAVAAE